MEVHMGSSISPTLAESLTIALECPVCYHLATPPIIQCREGHVVCSSCLAKLGICPICRCDIMCRNRALERLCENFSFPCPHAESGCLEKFKLIDLRKHADCCSHDVSRMSAFCCPLHEWRGSRRCDWTCDSAELIAEHLRVQHKSETVRGDVCNHSIFSQESPGSAGWNRVRWAPDIVLRYGHAFLSEAAVMSDGTLALVIRYLGFENQSFTFSCIITGHGPNGLQYTYEGPIRSTSSTLDSLAIEGQCLLLSPNVIRSLCAGANRLPDISSVKTDNASNGMHLCYSVHVLRNLNSSAPIR